jgi:transposase
MIAASDSARVYLACGATDMRKSVDGLAAIVKHSFELDPFDTSLFVFCNRACDRLKILQWEHNGFWLHYRRLETGRFRWPASGREVRTITHRQLTWLLAGLALEQKQAHTEVRARLIA